VSDFEYTLEILAEIKLGAENWGGNKSDMCYEILTDFGFDWIDIENMITKRLQELKDSDYGAMM